jgi:DNA invertase Pin-like site-specific DNA recombinase
MATYGYVRVSTQRQADEGESLAVQQRQITGYATMIGVEAPTFFIEEGVSGTKPLGERPAGSELLAQLQRGDVIVCAKLDRMFRSALDALTMAKAFKEKGVSLHLIDLGGDVTGNGISKLFFTIISAVAEAERDRIAQRVLDVKRDQKQRGRHLGGSRQFGYQISEDGELIEDENEQAAIRKAVAMKQAGASLRDIQAVLVADGHNVSHVGISRFLKREAEKGLAR